MRLIFAFLTVFLVSCSNDDGDIKMQTPTQQTIYADETNLTNCIRFVANNSWKATVSPSTRAAGVDWITLSAYSGGIGENAISITLTINNTGQDRKADIIITTGDATITITIEQKATTKDGNEPSATDGNLITKIIQQNYYKSGGKLEDDGEETYEFTYDENNRLIKIVATEENSIDGYTGSRKNSETTVTTFNITYTNGMVAYEMTTTTNGVEQKVKPSGSIVLKNGRAISGTCIDYDENSSGNFAKYVTTYTLSYDANGYLVKSSRIEDGEDTDDELITWTNGNPTQVVWGYQGSTQLIDKATYDNVKNLTNLDLNWLLALNSEGWDFAAGDSYKVFAAIGYTGTRSTHLASSITDGAEAVNAGNRKYTYTYQLNETSGLPVKITRKTNAEYGEESEFTIVYAK